MTKRLYIFILFIILPLASYSQSINDKSEWGAWLDVQATKVWNKKLSTTARFEHRSDQNFANSAMWFLMADVGYKIRPWLQTDLSYEFWQIAPQITNHKIVFICTGTLKRDALSVALREKLEWAMNPVDKPTWTLRSRLKAQYAIGKGLLCPYIMYEFFNWSKWIRSLHYLGAEINITDHSSFDVFYMYHLQNGGPSIHTLGFGYNFRF